MKIMLLSFFMGVMLVFLGFMQLPQTNQTTYANNAHTKIAQQDSMALLSYTIVTRNTNTPFSIFVDKVRQDNKIVGIIDDGKKKDWGKNALVYDIKLPKGTKIAEIAVLEKDAKTCWILTLRDNNKQELPIYKGSMEMDYIGIKYLIEKGYL